MARQYLLWLGALIGIAAATVPGLAMDNANIPGAEPEKDVVLDYGRSIEIAHAF
jgi:hypothetical protein